jgi:hypothetical protein
MVFLIVLGSGSRLFDEADNAQALELVDRRASANGAVVFAYHPAR